MYIETHQCTRVSLPQMPRHRWESVYRPTPRTWGGVRGSRGVAVLFKEELREVVHVVHKDVEAHYMWICLSTYRPRDVYIAVCYFPLAHSWYALGNESLYLPLNDDILCFSSMGDVPLVGEFNARIASEQSALYIMDDRTFCELAMDDIGLARSAQDVTEITEYGCHFLALGSAHGLVIFNGLAYWSGSDAFTC